jgi:Tfp pilus assembly protein PilO
MTPRSVRRVVAGVVGVLIVLGWYVGLWSPTQRKVSQLATNLSSTNSSISQATAQLDTLQGEKRGIRVVESEVTKLTTALPSSPGLVSFLKTLDVAASRVGLSLINLTPTQPSVVGGASNLPVSTSAPGSSPQSKVGPSVGFSLQTEGGYFQIEKLLSAMDRLPRLVVITSVSLAAVGPTVAGYPQSDGEILTATVKGLAYESKKG